MAAQAQQQGVRVVIDEPSLEAGEEGKAFPAVEIERQLALLDGGHLEKIEFLQAAEIEADLFTLRPKVRHRCAGIGAQQDDRFLDHDILGEGAGIHAVAEHPDGVDADAQVVDVDRKGLFAGRDIEAEEVDIAKADTDAVDGAGVAEDGLHSGQQVEFGLFVHPGPAPGAG